MYVPNGVIQEAWTPADEGRSYEVHADPRTLAVAQERPAGLVGAHPQHRTRLGGRRRRPCQGGSQLPDRHSPEEDFRRGHPAGSFRRSGCCERGRQLDSVPFDRTGHRAGPAGRQLRFRVQLCLLQQHFLAGRGRPPNPPEIDPSLVFERMFGDAEEPLDNAARARRMSRRRSVLDHVLDDANRLLGSVGPTDRQKLDEYFSSLRDVERRIEAERSGQDAELPNMPRPRGIPASYSAHARLMFDLMTLAFRTNMTRVATFMMGREGSNLTYPEIEVNRGPTTE